MFEVNNFLEGNANIDCVESLRSMRVMQHDRDMSVGFGDAVKEFYAAKMNVRKRQLVCDLSQSNIKLQAGAMQWVVGASQVKTGVKGVADFAGKLLKGKATGETAVKPEYTGSGLLVCEPTYKHLLLVNPKDWQDGLVISDGMFLACESHIEQDMQMRDNISSAVAGGEGLFNLALSGDGAVCLECNYPREELVEVKLSGDTLKVDGSYAVAWSGSLSFTVEKVMKGLFGSAASGEGFVNVYKGTGTVWMMPV